MSENVENNDICVPSDDIVAREIEGELIIVPLTSGIGDLEDELFTLNNTAKAIWENLNGKKTVEDIISDLLHKYKAEPEKIEQDVKGLLKELLKRKIITKKSK